MLNRLWLTALAATSMAGGVARAQDDPVAPLKGTYVVVVGVGQFADPAIQPRPSAEADARAIYDFYADPKFGPAQKDRVVLLTATADVKRNSRKATRENVVKALHEAVEKTSKDDTIIFALFGRGASSGDATCLFTAETNFKERAKTGLLGSDLETELKPATDRKIAVMMDVAFKGFDAGKETLAEPGLRDVLGAVFGGEERGEQPPPHDKVVMLASIPANPPISVGENGLFATTALEALRGAADTDGYEPDGLVVVDELVKYLEAKIPAKTRELGKTPQEKEAVPFIVGEETAHFVMAKNPALTPTVVKREAAVAALAAAGKLPKEAAEEAEKLVGRMPKLKAQQELRKSAEQLADATITPEQFLATREQIRESLKLPVEDADRFARTVLRAIDAVQPDYVKDIEPGEWAANAVKGLYRRLEEPVPEDIAAKIKEPKKLSSSAMEAVLREARLKLGKREDLEGGKATDTTITMMLAELRDPYTVYYDEATIKKMDAPLRGQFRGVGIQIRRDLVRDGLLVVSPIKDSPAYKAGIRAGDLVTAIKRDVNAEGEPLKADEPTEISTKGMKTEKALEIILGKPGVPVTLVVDRDGKTQEFTIKRGIVSVETVIGIKRDENDDWKYILDDDSKIGYVCLTQFAPGTSRDLRKAIQQMKADGARGVVLDLRFNPGGLLTEAVAVCDLFLKDGLIVSVKYRSRRPEQWFDRGFGSETDFPMAVLINGQSASASEIVSACLQDYNRAVVVGERSYGKGSVQTVQRFSPTKGEIKMTTARYFPPLDRNIDKHSTPGKPEDEWGVKPNPRYEVKLSREEAQDLAEHTREREVIKPKESKEPAKPFKDRQLETAVDYLKRQVKAAGAVKPRGDG